MARPGIVFAKDWMVDDCGSHASTKYQARLASAKGLCLYCSAQSLLPQVLKNVRY
jgi:hypothetical protein